MVVSVRPSQVSDNRELAGSIPKWRHKNRSEPMDSWFPAKTEMYRVTWQQGKRAVIDSSSRRKVAGTPLNKSMEIRLFVRRLTPVLSITTPNKSTCPAKKPSAVNCVSSPATVAPTFAATPVNPLKWACAKIVERERSRVRVPAHTPLYEKNLSVLMAICPQE